MSKMTIVRTGMALPTDVAMVAVRQLLFKCFDGFLDADKKLWRRFWKRFIDLQPGEMAQAEFVIPRNYLFHKKFFALLNFGFEHWEPERKHKTYKGRPVAKNFEQFREDVTILAGYFEQTFDLHGRMRLKAKSIKFSSMDDAEFEALYSAVVDVLLARVFTKYKDRAELDAIIEKLMGFV